jgi:ABC-2 type transport system permease protein
MEHSKLKAWWRVFWSACVLQSKERAVSQYFLATLLFQPIIFTLISVGTYMYGRKPDLGLFAITGTGLISIWNNNLWTSGDIIYDERRSGTLSLILATPTAFPMILLGKSFTNAITSLLAMGITFATGILAFGLPISIADPFDFILGLFLIVISVTCLGLVLGSLFVLTRNAVEFVTAANFPVYILSGLSLPLTLLPLWTRPFSAVLAPTWGNLLLNQAAGGGANLLPSYAWLIGLSLFYLALSAVLYKRVENLALRAGTLEQW